jgi:hypothetical protein
MKSFGGKKGQKLIIILLSLLVLVVGFSVYFSLPVALREGAVGSSSGNTGALSSPSSITNIKDVLSLPGVGKNSVAAVTSDNWAMVNEIVEPDGTVVQDIVNTDGTVLTITNKQNIINQGYGSSSGSGNGSSSSGSSGSGGNSGSITFNRDVYNS